MTTHFNQPNSENTHNTINRSPGTLGANTMKIQKQIIFKFNPFIMKNHFLGLAALLLLFAVSSCKEESVETAGGEKQIKFRTFLGKASLGNQSRAAEMDLAGLKVAADKITGVGIPVNIYNQGTATSWKNLTLTWDGTDWEYGSSVFAPSFNLDYYSWYPSSTVSAITNTAGAVTFNYTVPATQEDLIVASKLNTNAAVIDLAYSHILSQVNFAIQKVENVKITLSNIKLNGIVSGKTYTYGSGWSDLTLPTTTDYTYTPVSGSNVTDGTIIAPNIQTMKGTNNALMLLPQSFTTATPTFTFDFSLASMDNHNLASGTGTAILQDLAVNTWEAGKRYLYVIDFTDYLADRVIRFNVTVNPWEDATPDNTIPLGVAQPNSTSISEAISTLLNTYTTHTKYQIDVETAPADDIVITLPATLPTVGKVITINFEAGRGGKNVALASGTDAKWAIDNTDANITTLTFTP